MRKFFLMLAMLGMMSLTFAGCLDSAPAGEDAEVPADEEVIEPEVVEPDVDEPDVDEPDVDEPEVDEPEEDDKAV